jgi:hypothetical protein
MRATIESPAERCGRLDGDVDAMVRKPMDAVAAFARRSFLSRLREDEFLAYAAAYNEAYETECLLQIDYSKTGSWTVRS